MNTVHVQILDAFGGIILAGNVELADGEIELLDGRMRSAFFTFPGTQNAALQWAVVFHGETKGGI